MLPAKTRASTKRNYREDTLDRLLIYLAQGGAARAEAILKTTDDKQFMTDFLAMLEYVRPKLARTELTGNTTEDVRIKID